MENLQTLIENYLEYCRTQKCLDEKTLKAYRIDLRQFSEEPSLEKITEITPNNLEDYIARLHQQYKPKTVKRKIASIKAFFHYLEYKELLAINPFTKIQVHFREPTILPKEEVVDQVLPDIVPLSLPVCSYSGSSLETTAPAFPSIRANRPNNSNVKMVINGVSIEIDTAVSEEFLGKLIKAVCHA